MKTPKPTHAPFSSLTRVLSELPEHKSELSNQKPAALSVSGAVRTPLTISVERLRCLLRVKLSEDFECLEGWVVKGVLWEGIPIKSILQLGGLKKSAKFLLFRSGDYTYGMSLKKALRNNTLLALKKSDRWISRDHGGPIRLVFEGHDCYESVKHVDTIEVLKVRPAYSARQIALSRIDKV